MSRRFDVAVNEAGAEADPGARRGVSPDGRRCLPRHDRGRGEQAVATLTAQRILRDLRRGTPRIADLGRAIFAFRLACAK